MTAVPATEHRSSQTLEQSAAATVVLLVGTVVLSMVVSGAYLDYVQEWFRPYLLAAGLAMEGLGTWTLLEAAEGRPAAGHHHRMPRVGLLLVLPALLFTLATPSSLGAIAGNQAVAPVAGPRLELEPLPTDRVSELSLADYQERYQAGRRSDLVGRAVRLTGFVAAPRENQAGWTLNRFRVFCCVADAQLFSVVVTGAPMPPGAEVWAEVEGVIDLPASGSVPVLQVSRVQVVPVPQRPYL